MVIPISPLGGVSAQLLCKEGHSKVCDKVFSWRTEPPISFLPSKKQLEKQTAMCVCVCVCTSVC